MSLDILDFSEGFGSNLFPQNPDRFFDVYRLNYTLKKIMIIFYHNMEDES